VTVSPPPPSPPVSLDALYRAVRDLCHSGAQEADLIDTPRGRAFLDLSTSPADPIPHRAIRARRLLLAAVHAVGTPASDAATALLQLHPPGRTRPSLAERRERAADAYQLQPETFRRHHERRVILAVALEVHKRLDPTRPGNSTLPNGGPPTTPPRAFTPPAGYPRPGRATDHPAAGTVNTRALPPVFDPPAGYAPPGRPP
jgi:hypothetical protein